MPVCEKRSKQQYYSGWAHKQL
jgi:hypothetical protein